jgi:hypothetical protein
MLAVEYLPGKSASCSSSLSITANTQAGSGFGPRIACTWARSSATDSIDPVKPAPPASTYTVCLSDGPSSKWKNVGVHAHMSFSARTMPSHRVSPPTGTKMATSGPFFSHVSAVSTKGASTVLAFWKAPEV